MEGDGRVQCTFRLSHELDEETLVLAMSSNWCVESSYVTENKDPWTKLPTIRPCFVA